MFPCWVPLVIFILNAVSMVHCFRMNLSVCDGNINNGYVGFQSVHKRHKPLSYMSSTTALNMSSNIVVISPPGGVGEQAAVKSACLGSSVRWLVISDPTEKQDESSSGAYNESSEVKLSPQSLRDISDSSGSLKLAGATVNDILNIGRNKRSAFSTWCGANDGFICTYDGVDNGKRNDPNTFKAALRVAATEVSQSVSGPCIAVLSAEEDLESDRPATVNGGLGIPNLVGSIIGGKSINIPSNLPISISGASGGDLFIIRHGKLFGKPESSPNFSPLVGGPKRDAVISKEYTMRTVRIDPFIVSRNIIGSSSQLKSCRHSVGESAALLAARKISIPVKTTSNSRFPAILSISSQSGTENWSLDQWKAEINRVQQLVDSGKDSTLFSQDMIVEDTERLADWLQNKWAPAVLRTYDIAAIRVGARPVSTSRSGKDQIDIIWQELVDFDSVVVGKMILKVTENGILATRGEGDVTRGYGSISTMPLNGEDVLVGRLAEAASQAMEKGLAKRVLYEKNQAKKPLAKPVSSLKSSGSVEVTSAKPSSVEPTKSAGPRKAGAKRSISQIRKKKAG